MSWSFTPAGHLAHIKFNLIISFPSPTLSFIQDLKPSFSANPFPLQPFFFFFRTDYMIPQTFTVTSEHIRFYFLVFLFYLCYLLLTDVICCLRAVD